MTPTFINIDHMTQYQAFAWLSHNDPEGEWSMGDGADYLGAVKDNLRDFGMFSQTGPIIVSDASYSELLEKLCDMEASLRRLTPEIIAAIDGIGAIVGQSRGVAGYHLNGDVADWDSFEEIDALLRVAAMLRRQQCVG